MNAFGDTVWVKHVWRSWAVDGGSDHALDTTRAARQYAHWRFADELANQARQDDIARGVMMQKLWNAVDGRVGLLFELYNLATLVRSLGWSHKRGPTRLEMLTRLGLVRPLALARLKDIRNAIEHADAEPPSHDEVLNLVDLVWYFLRSTDVYVSHIVRGIEVVLPDEAHANDPIRFGTCWVSVGYPLRTWTPTLRGTLPMTEISAEERPDHLAIDLSSPVRPNGDVVSVQGTIRPSGPAFEAFVKSYFRHDLIEPD